MDLHVPGDKSLTHRALLFAALATGESRIRRPLVSDDTMSTAGVLRSLGVEIHGFGPGNDEVRVVGRGLRGLSRPGAALDCGNSGTTARLMVGALAAQSLEARLTGDESLRGRPMDRVVDPLRLMGADLGYVDQSGCLPLDVRGRDLRPLDYQLPVASAQVKSALLLAGLTGNAFVLLTEPGHSRDHTERLLAAMGAPTIGHAVGGGWRVELRDPPARIDPLDFTVPADPSTAAFFAVWALLNRRGATLSLEGVGLNPTRIGLFRVLERMGADIETTEQGGGIEPVGDLRIRGSELRATSVDHREVPTLIDEIPLVAVAAARAVGVTRITGAAELRLKESDRLSALAANLRSVGVDVEEYHDGLAIEGTDCPLSGPVHTYGDHRIEMAFGVLGATPDVEIEITGPPSAAVSYPGFWADLGALVAESGSESSRPPRGAEGDTPRDGPQGAREGNPGESTDRGRRPVITIDGPAGSGKSTTARAVATRLGLPHLDSGALYRALTWAALKSGLGEDEWSQLTSADWADFGLGVRSTAEGMTVLQRGEPIDDRELRAPGVTARVSVVAALPAVRECLLGLQRQAAAGGVVADGRDMGSIVFPDADVKVFLTADLEERARRRLLESGGDANDTDRVSSAAGEIRDRDARDTSREHSPLRMADDAVVIDTTRLTMEEQIQTVVDLVGAKGRGGSGNHL